MTIDTGFSKHVDVLVDAEGEYPDDNVVKHVRSILGKRKLFEKWIDVTGRGYEKNWMWVVGY